HERLRAVDGIDEPPAPRAGRIAELLTEDLVSSEAGTNPLACCLLGGAIGDRDGAGAALCLPAHAAAVVAERPVTRDARRGCHGVEQDTLGNAHATRLTG